MNILVDTNILLRSFEPLHPQNREAEEAADLLGKRGHVLCIVPQNLYEFWAVSTRPAFSNGRGKTPAEVQTELTFLETHFAMFPDTPAVFDEWKHLVAAYQVIGKPSHDARLVAAMHVHGITHLLTFNDPDFRRYTTITALAPASVIAPPSATP